MKEGKLSRNYSFHQILKTKGQTNAGVLRVCFDLAFGDKNNPLFDETRRGIGSIPLGTGLISEQSIIKKWAFLARSVKSKHTLSLLMVLFLFINSGVKAQYTIESLQCLGLFNGLTSFNQDGAVHRINSNDSEVFDLVLPPTYAGRIELTAKGGDGGTVSVYCGEICGDLYGNGGRGRLVTASFVVGPYPGQIPVGSTLRFIIGQEGAGTSNSGYFRSGGGGGGTAVIYQTPNTTNWLPLIVAGGGGGGRVTSASCILCTPGSNDHGKDANGGVDGSSGGGYSNAGVNGSGGGVGDTAGGGGGGGGRYSAGGDTGRGCFGAPIDGGGGNAACDVLSVGGNFPSVCEYDFVLKGGDGYGSGGAGAHGLVLNPTESGGGGGYSGGGGGYGGGGGGSYVSGLGDEITNTVERTGNGYVEYQAFPAPANATYWTATTAVLGTTYTHTDICESIDCGDYFNLCGLPSSNQEGSVWYKITGNGNQYTVTINGNKGQMRVYRGPHPQNLFCVGSASIATPGSTTDDVVWCSNPGTNYFMLVETDNTCQPVSLTITERGDLDGDGYTICNGDCNDDDASIYPGAPELCDGKDNNCNSTVDDIGTLYVNAAATLGANNGVNWENAFLSLQDALAAAATCNVDRIYVAAGTYYPSASNANASFVLQNNLRLYGGFANTGNPSFTQRNPTDNPTILSGEIGSPNSVSDNSLHVVRSNSNNNTALIEGFIITGAANGGMFNNNSTPVINRCVFTNNLAAANGGGMLNMNSSPTVSDCTFSENSADADGGGMYNNGSNPIVSACTFSNNQATANGGGMYNENSEPVVSNSSFLENSAAQGGGIYTSGSSPSVTNCSFKGNEAGLGGGVYNSGASPDFINCIYIGNNATSTAQGGGAIYNTSSSPTITNCSFSGNNANAGGGIYNNASSPTISNSILWGNSSEVFTASGSPPISSSAIEGGCPAGAVCSDIWDEDPLFASQPTIGLGVAGDLHLPNCSPFIDLGDNGAVPAGVTSDLDGNNRKFNATGTGAIVDFGAYELNTTYSLCSCFSNIVYVKPTGSQANTGKSWDDAFSDLQDALALANSCSSITEIWVAEGTYTPTVCSSCTSIDKGISFSMKSGLTIYGGFPASGTPDFSQRDWVANPTILSGNIGPNAKSYHVINNASSVNNTAVLDGVQIRDGDATGNSTSSIYGGGMYNYYGAPVVRNCIFIDNRATEGGAVYNYGGYITFENCIFSSNTATLFGGGALYNYAGSPSLTNCTFYGNIKSSGNWPEGRSIYSNSAYPVEVANCIFWPSGNSSSGSEIARIYNSKYNITNSISYNGCPTGSGITCTNVSNENPLFVDAPNGDLRLRSCSPAVDAGTGTAGATDLDGNNRIFNGTIDIGAYEWQADGNLCNQPPVANCKNITVSANENCEGIAVAEDFDNGSVDPEMGALSFSVSPGGPYLLGATSVTLTVTDIAGEQSSCTATITVEAPISVEILTAAPVKLWPADYNYQTFTIAQMVGGLNSSSCGGSLSLDDVWIHRATSDEAEDDPSTQDGSTLDDIVISPDCDFIQLRRERMNAGNGRVYTVTLAVQDAGGNVSYADYKVQAPRWPWGWYSNAVEDAPLYQVDCGTTGNALIALPEGVLNTKPVISGDVNFTLYPNPARQEVYVRLDDFIGQAVELIIYDKLGRLVQSIRMDEVQIPVQRIEVNKLAYGTYLMQLRTDQQVLVKTFVILE